jgi:hypothetical protein
MSAIDDEDPSTKRTVEMLPGVAIRGKANVTNFSDEDSMVVDRMDEYASRLISTITGNARLSKRVSRTFLRRAHRKNRWALLPDLRSSGGLWSNRNKDPSVRDYNPFTSW